MLITTERLQLRRFSSDDVDNIYLLDNDPEVMRYNNGGISTSRATVETKLLPTMLPQGADNAFLGFWAVESKTNGGFLGWVSLRLDMEGQKPIGGLSSAITGTLGYRFVQSSWGNGFATEAVTKLLDMGFDRTSLESVQATTYEENLASIRVMQKLGMLFVEKFRFTEDDLGKSDTTFTGETGIWDGFDVRYSLTKQDWLSHRSKQLQ